MAEQRAGGRPYRYEVDLRMLPKGTDSAQLERFCQVLQRIMDDEGTDLALVVPCERADNDGATGRQMAWGWPTEENWREAVYEAFGGEVAP